MGTTRYPGEQPETFAEGSFDVFECEAFPLPPGIPYRSGISGEYADIRQDYLGGKLTDAQLRRRLERWAKKAELGPRKMQNLAKAAFDLCVEAQKRQTNQRKHD